MCHYMLLVNKMYMTMGQTLQNVQLSVVVYVCMLTVEYLRAGINVS